MQTATNDRFISLIDVMRLTSLRKAFIYTLMARGTFPKAIKIGRKSVWLEREVQDFIREQSKSYRLVQNAGAYPRPNERTA